MKERRKIWKLRNDILNYKTIIKYIITNIYQIFLKKKKKWLCFLLIHSYVLIVTLFLCFLCFISLEITLSLSFPKSSVWVSFFFSGHIFFTSFHDCHCLCWYKFACLVYVILILEWLTYYEVVDFFMFLLFYLYLKFVFSLLTFFCSFFFEKNVLLLLIGQKLCICAFERVSLCLFFLLKMPHLTTNDCVSN